MITIPVGEHVVKCGDVMDGLDDLMGYDKADIFYSDPPWGEGNLRYWQTMNHKQTGETPREVNFEKFLATIVSQAKRFTQGFVCIEYGVRWADQLKDTAAAYGLHHCDTVAVRYRSGSKILPLHLHVFHVERYQPVDLSDVAGSIGYETVIKTMKKFQKAGGIVLDPCCGKGYSAKAALELGMKFRGNELNSKRLAETIARLKGEHGT